MLLGPARFSTPVFATIVLALVEASCSRGNKTQSPALPDRIAVGATLPISGRDAKTARFYREGYELAAELANHDGGLLILGKRIPVSLEIVDDANDPAAGVRALDALVASGKASFFLGSAASSVVEAQSARAAERKVPYVTAAGAEKPLYQRGNRYLFGIQAPVGLLAYSIMRWVDEQQKSHRLPSPVAVAVLAEEGPQGREFREGIVDFANKSESRRASYRIVFDELFPPTSADFGPVLTRVKAARADVFIADASLANFLALHRGYVAQKLCHKVLSYGERGSELEALESLGLEPLTYLISAVWWSHRTGSGAASEAFVNAFKDTYHRDPEWYGALAYEAARALFTAIEEAGTVDPEQVRNRLAALRMKSILPGGFLAFGPDGQAQYPFVVQQNMPDGKQAIVYPRDLAQSAGVAARPNCR
jgi:branched-chain amino acid transport system substrate-binding protein